MGKLNRITCLFQIVAVLFFLGSSTAFGATLIVDASGTGDYTTIQDAINAATTVDGDTILVRDGIYTENITVNKQLTIMSEHGNETMTVAAADSSNHVFTIAANNVTIRGFSIYGATAGGRAGIYIYGDVENSILTENRCGYDATHMNYLGIYLHTTTGHVVSNNICMNNTQGILLSGVANTTVTTNTCIGNAVNIKLNYAGPNNTISGNNLENGNYGIWLSDSEHNVITDNAINDNGEGIAIYYSNANTVSRNACLNNGYGLDLSMSFNNLLSGNTCTEGTYGIYIYGGGTNRVFDNIFSNNDKGVQLNASNTNVFRGNTISSNN
jgi:parallel beta-helix repeat protein